MDIKKLSGGAPIDTACLDLMMYGKDELLESSLNFMRRRYGQRRALLGFLPKVTLLQTPKLPLFEDFKMLDQELQQLRYFIRSYEVWGVRTKKGALDKRTYFKTRRMLDKLQAFLYAGTEVEVVAPSDEQRRRSIKGYIAQENRAINDMESSNNIPAKPNNKTSEDIEALADNAPSRIILRKGLKPNKLHQALLRNMGMAREVLFHGVMIEYELMKNMVNSRGLEGESGFKKDLQDR